MVTVWLPYSYRIVSPSRCRYAIRIATYSFWDQVPATYDVFGEYSTRGESNRVQPVNIAIRYGLTLNLIYALEYI